MARKKQTPIPLSSDVIKNIAIMVITVILLFYITKAVTDFLKTSPVFNIRHVIIPMELQSFFSSELTSIKGENIFLIRLSDIEKSVRSKHEELAHLRVIKKFPDTIEFFAVKREPMAWVNIQGEWMTIDQEGYLISKDKQEAKAFPLIKGLKKQRMLSGDQIQDSRFKAGVQVIQHFTADTFLMNQARLKTVDITDLTRLVCVLDVGGDELVVYLDKDYIAKKSSVLASILNKHQFDITKINHIDLRETSPVVSPKKTSRK